MSVLACDRGNCENIMCSRLICDGKYYICDECWAELLAYRDTWPTEMTKLQVRLNIDMFMRTDPGSHVTLDEDQIETEFRELTRSEHR